MKAVVIDQFGGPETLKLKNIAVPQPTDNQVQIQIAYAAVNPVDWKIREGKLKSRLPHEFPIILGWDGSGTLSAVGKNVRNFKVGDEVYGYFRQSVVQTGTYAEYVCIDASQIALKPKNLSFAQAAAIPLGALTAWQSLFDSAKLKKGETILIHAGAGGVGSMAIQLAKVAEAYVITTASASKQKYVKSLGADWVIDYNKQDFVAEIAKKFPDGIDVVCDLLGEETYRSSFKVLRPGGRIVSLLEVSDPLLAEKYRVTPSYVFVSPSGTQLQKIAELIEQGKVQPPVIEEMRLEEAAMAQEKVKAGHTLGKIVLEVSGEK